jgi:XapX domain-containing protein
MKIYFVSLGAGVLVGMIYGFLNVRSPAPPLVALIGLAGILIGEQVIPIGKQVLNGASIGSAWNEARCRQHIFGMLPGHHSINSRIVATKAVEKQT